MIEYIKDLIEKAEAISIDNLVANKYSRRQNIDAVAIADYIAYKMNSQSWITEKDEPQLYKINEAAIIVDCDHTNRKGWENLIHLAKRL